MRSSSSQLGNLNAGLTTGVYQLQVRLRELDEVPGSAIRMADIRYAVNGIEVTGGPGHSPLTGEAAEAVDAQGNDTNNDLTTPDNLGNLFNTDRGTLSVAGALANAGDVDWYQFDVRYDAVQTDDPNAPRHASVAFDIDYADGFARANTNLWVFNDVGPVGAGRWRLGYAGRPPRELDPLDGRSVARFGGSPGSVHWTRRVAGGVRIGSRDGTSWPYRPTRRSRPSCSSSSQPTSINPLVRLEPVNSVNRVAEDHIASTGYYTTANAPTVPVLFGLDDQVTLFIPAGSQLKDGESFTVTNAAGAAMTYEFDADGAVTPGRIAIPYAYDDTATDIGVAAAEAISLNLPLSLTVDDLLPDLTKDAPVIISALSVSGGANGQVILAEIGRRVHGAERSHVDRSVHQSVSRSSQSLATTRRVQDPQVRQSAAPGEARAAVYVSRPAAADYTLGDVTMFVTEPSRFSTNRTELLSVDAFTGAQETRIGYFGASVGDLAMHPQGALPASRQRAAVCSPFPSPTDASPSRRQQHGQLLADQSRAGYAGQSGGKHRR